MGNEESKPVARGNGTLADIASRTIQEKRKGHESGKKNKKILGILEKTRVVQDLDFFHPQDPEPDPKNWDPQRTRIQQKNKK